ncbi:MAG: terpene cyclase/mutase family protein [Defluviitaleaceae bacterium]|nr:terpene cyclase/mutase family protein [Defluviitaleaceae bacterium]
MRVDVDIQTAIRDRLKCVDYFLCVHESLEDVNISDMAEKLIRSFRSDGSVPYIIEGKDRFRTTPLATVIEALYSAHLLPNDVCNIMQDKLISYRDTFVPEEDEDKSVCTICADDKGAWGADEGVSVWTTSKALISLIASNYHKRDDSSKEVILTATKWLSVQQFKNDGGWGFQKHDGLQSCVPMTSLALKAISKVVSIDAFSSDADMPLFKLSIESAKKYLLAQCKDDTYFTFDGEPSLTATVWAIEALKAAGEKGRRIKRITNNAIEYFLESIPDEISSWKSEVFVKAGTQTRYKIIKRDFCSFMPYLMVPLFEWGLKLTHPKVVSVIRWLLEKRNDSWKIADYNAEEPCTFSSAMALNVIVNWFRQMETQSSNFAIKNLLYPDTESTDENLCLGCIFVEIPGNKKDEETILGKNKQGKEMGYIWTICIALICFIVLIPYIIPTFAPFVNTWISTNMFTPSFTAAILASIIAAVLINFGKQICVWMKTQFYNFRQKR